MILLIISFYLFVMNDHLNVNAANINLGFQLQYGRFLKESNSCKYRAWDAYGNLEKCLKIINLLSEIAIYEKGFEDFNRFCSSESQVCDWGFLSCWSDAIMFYFQETVGPLRRVTVYTKFCFCGYWISRCASAGRCNSDQYNPQPSPILSARNTTPNQTRCYQECCNRN